MKTNYSDPLKRDVNVRILFQCDFTLLEQYCSMQIVHSCFKMKFKLRFSQFLQSLAPIQRNISLLRISPSHYHARQTGTHHLTLRGIEMGKQSRNPSASASSAPGLCRQHLPSPITRVSTRAWQLTWQDQAAQAPSSLSMVSGSNV